MTTTFCVEDVSIDGIPCQAIVDTWPAERQTRHHPGCDAGWELCQVLDRKGYPAPWLERKLKDPKVKEAFEESVDQELDNMAQAAEDAYWDLKYEEYRDRRMGL